MKWIIITGLLVSFAFAGLTDDAYSHYKKRDYIEAIRLYKQAAKKGTHAVKLKAYYNLGIFYLRGMGTVKNRAKALKNFRMAVLNAQGVVETLDRTYYKDETLKILHNTYQYLAKLEHTPIKRRSATKNANKLERVIAERKIAKKREKAAKKHPENRRAAAFLRNCPFSRVVSTIDREFLERYECRLYRLFPQTMKRYLHLVTLYDQYARKYNDKGKEKIKKQMEYLLKPVFRLYLQEKADCIKKAKTRGDLFACKTTYLSRIDNLLFVNNIEQIADAAYLFSTDQERKERSRLMREAISEKERNRSLEEVYQNFQR